MRLTPAQIAIRLICGDRISPFARGPSTLSQRIRDGHDQLVRMTNRDFGYDLQAWHDYLKVSRDGGYTYGGEHCAAKDHAGGVGIGGMARSRAGDRTQKHRGVG
jgi:hypothetical protein